ncbi:MAG: 2-oxo acid dehydrogenase subunit E2 [Phycisphaerales bacterium JB063]
MPIVPIRIPQLGEGLAEAILVEFIKQPGDVVKRDDPLYTMETDKANSDVESPFDGKIVAWSVEPGSVLPIGAEVGQMEVAEGVKDVSTNPHRPPAQAASPAPAPPSSSEPAGGDGNGTKLTAIRIPQLGEGLAEAVLVEYLKKPGETVKRDDPLYTMETDKANSDVESPFDGEVVEWTAEPGSVLPIGAQVGTMRVAASTSDMAAGHGPAAPAQSQSAAATNASHSTSTNGHAIPAADIRMPPRTRKLLRDTGLLDQAGRIPFDGATLMPADVERYRDSGDAAPAKPPAAAHTEAYDEAPLPVKQQTLNHRLIRGAQVCVPVVVVTDADWSRMDTERAKVKAAGGGPTSFAMMLWCVTQVMKRHPNLRSTLDATGKILRTYKHINLGIAVALPGDLMVTAVVKDADTLGPDAFYDAVSESIALAREGKDQADAATTLTVSNMGTAGMELGIPAVAAPAVATLVLGKTFWQPVPDGSGGFDFIKTAKLTLAFDHRIVNGVGGGNFLGDIKHAIEHFEMAPTPASP